MSDVPVIFYSTKTKNESSEKRKEFIDKPTKAIAIEMITNSWNSFVFFKFLAANVFHKMPFF